MNEPLPDKTILLIILALGMQSNLELIISKERPLQELLIQKKS